MNRKKTVREIAEHVGGVVTGDFERVITGASSVANAGPSDLVFIEQDRYLKDLASSRAGAAILGGEGAPPPGMSAIRVRQAGVAMAQALELLYACEPELTGISPQAFLGKRVELGPGAAVGPGVYLGDDVKVGSGTTIHPGVTVGRGSVIGENCILYSGVHLYHGVTVGHRVILHSGAVIGADGFGFLQEKLSGPDVSPLEPVRHRKMAQIGTVIIEDDVEVGANTTIDRAALDATVIGRGTKIDNLVMIGHNCRVGRHALIISQVGISGSTIVGDYVTIAGQAGLAGHIKIGSRVIIGAQAGVTKDVEDAQIVLGAPAIDARQARKAYSLIESLPEFKKALADHTKRLEALEGKSGSLPADPGRSRGGADG